MSSVEFDLKNEKIKLPINHTLIYVQNHFFLYI